MYRLAPCFASLLVALTAIACVSEQAREVDDWDDGAPRLEGAFDDAQDDATAFFGPDTFYVVHIEGWPRDRMTPDRLEEVFSHPGATLRIMRANPSSPRHCSPGQIDGESLLHTTSDFSVRTSGNLTLGTPKSSYKIRFTSQSARLFGMRALNLKSMWNDVSQMRESIAWHSFERASVPASRHTYARFCINDRYYGLYSVIEQVDKSLLQRHFGNAQNDGNLYKVYWDDVGPGDLTHRHQGADDGGARYFSAADIDDRSYRLQTNEGSGDDPAHQTYDDLAELIRRINGVGGCSEEGCWHLGGGCNEHGCWSDGEVECTVDATHCDSGFDPRDRGVARFDTDLYRESVEGVFDVRAFLRWAAVNTLLGAWDNYWATPANYYLYNSGRDGGGKRFMDQPYFHFIPWDYDNTLGIDYFGTDWQRADIADWEPATSGYHMGRTTSNLPLIRNLLGNSDFLRYYLDFIEFFLDRDFNANHIEAMIGTEGSGGIWDRVRTSAFLESDSATGPPHTGRQFTNDQVYWNGFVHHALTRGSQRAMGILHFVRVRHDAARADLARLRETHPQGSSNAAFPATPTPLPPFLRDVLREDMPSMPGAVVISEIMLNPAAVDDEDGEWIELFNPGDTPWNLRGCDISDRSSRGGHIISDDVVVPPGGYTVLAVSDEVIGMRPDYSYDGAFGLSNSGESPTLRCGTVLVDSVDYEGFSLDAGAALQLDPVLLDHRANDDASAWCLASSVYGDGNPPDRGTPGATNESCAR